MRIENMINTQGLSAQQKVDTLDFYEMMQGAHTNYHRLCTYGKLSSADMTKAKRDAEEVTYNCFYKHLER